MSQDKEQVHGTQYLPTESGRFVVYRLSDPEGVNARRQAVGLCSLEENTKRIHREDELLDKRL